MSLRQFRRQINQHNSNSSLTVQSSLVEVDPTKEVCLSSILTSSPTNIEDNPPNPEILLFTNAFNFSSDNRSHLERLPVSFTTDVQNEVPKIEKKLQKLVVKYNVSNNCVNNLLEILRSDVGLKLPKDVRTLMKTPKQHNVVELNPGKYIHFGMEKMLKQILTYYKNNLNGLNQINIDFNIDGLPLAKSSRQQFWPILCSILNVPRILNSFFFCWHIL